MKKSKYKKRRGGNLTRKSTYHRSKCCEEDFRMLESKIGRYIEKNDINRILNQLDCCINEREKTQNIYKSRKNEDIGHKKIIEILKEIKKKLENNYKENILTKTILKFDNGMRKFTIKVFNNGKFTNIYEEQF